MFKIPKDFDETKAPGIDDLSAIFLKDDAKLLTTPITQLCNHRFPPEHFLMPRKQQQRSYFSKKRTRTDRKNYH